MDESHVARAVAIDGTTNTTTSPTTRQEPLQELDQGSRIGHGAAVVRLHPGTRNALDVGPAASSSWHKPRSNRPGADLRGAPALFGGSAPVCRFREQYTRPAPAAARVVSFCARCGRAFGPERRAVLVGLPHDLPPQRVGRRTPARNGGPSAARYPAGHCRRGCDLRVRSRLSVIPTASAVSSPGAAGHRSLVVARASPRVD